MQRVKGVGRGMFPYNAVSLKPPRISLSLSQRHQRRRNRCSKMQRSKRHCCKRKPSTSKCTRVYSSLVQSDEGIQYKEIYQVSGLSIAYSDVHCSCKDRSNNIQLYHRQLKPKIPIVKQDNQVDKTQHGNRHDATMHPKRNHQLLPCRRQG